MRETLYLTWAPAESPWSPWVKPVLFASLETMPLRGYLTEGDFQAPTPEEGMAVVVDLPGHESVAAGVTLARAGWRPVPLYNSLPETEAIVEMAPVVAGLWAGAEVLQGLKLPDSAPPAFLLDSRRLKGPLFPPAGSFDNRAVCASSDLPTAEFLRGRGVWRVLLVQTGGARPQLDLLEILRVWKTAGMRIDVRPTASDDRRERCNLGPASLWAQLWALVTWVFLERRPGGVYGRRLEKVSHGG